MTKKRERQNVFTPRYFEDGLRMDPECNSLVVYISDIDFNWVNIYITHPYRSSYVFRLLNALLNLGFQSPASRASKIAAHEQAAILKRVAELDLSNQSWPLSQEEQLELQKQNMTTQQKQIQRLIHGNDTNIDQDLWRLYGIYKSLFRQESEAYEHNMDMIENSAYIMRMHLPKHPRLQLMLRNDEKYLESKSGIRAFDKYEDVPEGQASPQSPILSALPQPKMQHVQPQSIEEICLQWTQRATTSEEDEIAEESNTRQSEYHIIDLPDIDSLQIKD
ncbi:hypothetical protein BGX27_001648 [Mortierella sp. AM989]|nr:hypothetical protein BGX27_001648 [Mortierella sp. AM989]